jgi:toxin ParE1/3/4
MKVGFSPRAATDLRDIGDYIHADSPTVARRFVSELRARCVRLSHAPKGGRLRPEIGLEIRSVPFGSYIIFYVVDEKEIRIERVLHGARDIENSYDEV